VISNLPPAAAPVLEVNGLRVQFGGLVAIDDLSFSLQPGQTLGIVGPNGAGKTVLVNAITGFAKPTGGSIRFHGSELAPLSPHEIARLGMARTFQNIRLFRRMTVLENVLVADQRYLRRPLRSVAGAFGRASMAHAIELLELFGLTSKVDQLAGALSYGDARRLEIARALAGKPKLLLLDEPAAGMNEQESAELIADVDKARSTIEAVIIIEHDLALITKLSDRVIAMSYGRKIADGTAHEVFGDERFLDAYIGKEVGHADADPPG
jgi:branched-chain amino acid transport system ATP-binding protein